MIHKRRATPSLESGGGERTTVVIDNGERRTPGAGTAFPRFGFPAREESRGSSGGTWAGRGGGGGSGSNGRGGLYRRKGGVESPSRSPSSAAKGKRRRGPAGGSMYWSRSIWFRVLCVTGGGFLLLMTGARRMGYSLSATTTRRRAAIVAAAAAREREMDADMGVEAELQERRLRMAMKHKTFETTPHTLKDLLELDSSFSRRGCSNDSIDVTAIIVGSSSLDAQLNALLGGSVQPTQPSGMTARDSRGVGGSDSGSFFDEKTGLFQLAMQAATKFVWIIDPGVLPGSKFLHLLAHVSTIKGMAGVYGSEGALMPAAPARGWRLNAPALSAQFRELSSRAGQFFWTPERCPKELVLLVVDGRRQAELLEPVYRALVESLAAAEDGDGDGDGDGGADGGGAEVFVAVITQGPDESEQGGRPPQPARRTARRDCTEVAEALAGVINGDGGNTANHVVSNDDDDDDSARRRRASKAFGAGRGHAPRWLRGYAEGGDDRKSRHLLSPEEFCLGSAFGVFQIRAGQDYRQAKGRPLDPYLEVFHGLSEVLEVARPKVVAYIASPPSRISPGGEASGGVRKPNPSKGDRAGVDEMLATASTGYDPEDTVVRAVEAALRSAADEGGGGASYSYRPIGVGLPPAEAGADAAKALAYLPAGCLELWDKPSITLVLVHPGGEDGGLLARTLRALSEAHYVGDRVELRLVLGARDASDPRINQIVRDLEWRWGDLDVTYFSDADGGGGNRLPAGLAALEAFADPKAHDHIVPLFSGGIPDPNFYVWLKVALINDGYAPLPVAGLPLTSQRLKRSLGFHVGRESSSNYGGGSSSGGGGLPPEDRGGTRTRIERRRLTANGGGGNDPGKMWGKFLSLSVDIPQGLCPAGRDGGCSRVWMYGSEAWGALRERCRVGLASELVGGGVGGEREGARGGGRGHGHRQGGLEPLEIACAVGDVAEWKGAEWGLEARRVCGAGPRDDGGSSSGGGGKWQRARVWEVYPLQQGR
eukprot:g6855.t1